MELNDCRCKKKICSFTYAPWWLLDVFSENKSNSFVLHFLLCLIHRILFMSDLWRPVMNDLWIRKLFRQKSSSPSRAASFYYTSGNASNAFEYFIIYLNVKTQSVHTEPDRQIHDCLIDLLPLSAETCFFSEIAPWISFLYNCSTSMAIEDLCRIQKNQFLFLIGPMKHCMAMKSLSSVLFKSQPLFVWNDLFKSIVNLLEVFRHNNPLCVLLLLSYVLRYRDLHLLRLARFFKVVNEQTCPQSQTFQNRLSSIEPPRQWTRYNQISYCTPRSRNTIQRILWRIIPVPCSPTAGYHTHHH